MELQWVNRTFHSIMRQMHNSYVSYAVETFHLNNWLHNSTAMRSQEVGVYRNLAVECIFKCRLVNALRLDCICIYITNSKDNVNYFKRKLQYLNECHCYFWNIAECVHRRSSHSLLLWMRGADWMMHVHVTVSWLLHPHASTVTLLFIYPVPGQPSNPIWQVMSAYSI